jgi:EAL and modified HD-GYP domain-containing signal transduction protein
MSDFGRGRSARPGGALGAAIAGRSAPDGWPTYVARQAVYDRDLNVVAYELLFRETALAREASVRDDERATGEAALTAVADIGLDVLVGSRRALVNVSRSFLLGEEVYALPPERVGLEVLETVEPDDALVRRLRELAVQGYEIVLDDFVAGGAADALLGVAATVKLDVCGRTAEEIGAAVDRLASRRVRMVAEKVESRAAFDACRELGFDLFQGFVFGVPQMMTGRRIRPARPTVLGLLNALARPDVTVQELEAIIVQDVGLSLTLLRYMNSAAVGLVRRISSIRDAIVFLGTDTIRSFAYLVSLTAHSRQPAELARIGMVRAKMMEVLARSLGIGEASTAFTVGLLSVADALLAVPMEVLLEELDELDERVARALADRAGELGAHLRWIESYERGRLGEIEPSAVSLTLLRDAYVRAVAWADETSACLGAPPLRRAS